MFDFNWNSDNRRVENFEQYFSSTKCQVTSIHSGAFGLDDDPGTKWSLQLFPKGDKDASSGNSGSETLSFFINLDKSSDILELPAKYSVAVVGNGCLKRLYLSVMK